MKLAIRLAFSFDGIRGFAPRNRFAYICPIVVVVRLARLILLPLFPEAAAEVFGGSLPPT